MGKKACLALDLGYDPWSDEYHEGDEMYDWDDDDHINGEYLDCHASNAKPSNNKPIAPIAKKAENICNKVNSNSRCCSASTSQPKNPFTVVTPKMAKTAQILHYVPNPHRRPLFTEHVASHYGLLIQVASFLSIREVASLSMVSKMLQKSLSIDGLYCNSGSEKEKDDGILLPCLWSVSQRLLPLDPDRCRQGGISRKFAYECLAFSKSLSRKFTIEPRTILSTKSPEQMNTISICQVQWEQYSYEAIRKGPTPPPQKSIVRSGIRISYVKSDANDCALVTMWSGEHCLSRQQSTLQTPFLHSHQKFQLKNGVTNQQCTKERYLPPNTKTIVEASIHSDSGLCAILSTPLEHYSTERYILSMVSLPTMPPGLGSTKKFRNDQNLSQPDEHILRWQKHLSSNDWELFSSSETQPIVSFSTQGKYVIFGSTERWGIIDAATGSQIWSLLGSTERVIASSLSQMRLANNISTTALGTASHDQTSKINAFLLHHEFLFLLERNGTLMRVYDVSNTSSREPLAEGNLLWTCNFEPRKKQAQGLVRLHHSHQHHRQLLRNEFQIKFCAGRIFITAMYSFDLLCTSPARLLRRLRSRLSNNISSTSGNDILSLQFTRIKNDLKLGTPHSMHTWNDTHLYVVDSNKIHCWSAYNSKECKPACVGNQITTVLTTQNFIESVYIDGTKIIVCTNETYRNTTTRSWDASGVIWVIPIDGHGSKTGTVPQEVTSHVVNKNQALDLSQPQSCSPIMQIFHKRFFNVQNFGRNAAILGSRNRPRYPISSSSNSNYQNVGDIISDGRYVVAQCKKGGSQKTVLFDLYSVEKEEN